MATFCYCSTRANTIMSTYIRFDKDNVVLPSFVKKNLTGQKKSEKMTTPRLQKLIDDEIRGSQDEFEMPVLLEVPIEFKATAAPPRSPNTEEVFKKMADKKIQLIRQQQLKQTQTRKPQEEQKKQKLPSLIHGPQVIKQLVPHIFHTDYSWWNGAFVPVHHHVTLVPQYSYTM